MDALKEFLLLGDEKGFESTLTVELKNFQPPEGAAFDKKILLSRTAFLDYLKDNTKDVAEEPVAGCSTATQELDRMESNPDQGAGCSTGSKESYTSKRTTEKKTQEQPDIRGREEKLIGIAVQINLENLDYPNKLRKLRELHDDHIQALRKQFEKEYIPFTPLVGVVYGEKPRGEEDVGDRKVEVLGGNHTFTAVKLLDNPPKTLPVRLYHNLTNEECLQLAFHHNTVHEFARETTFTDKCLIARRMLEENNTDMSKLTKKQIMIWKDSLSFVFSVTKGELNNKHRVLLHISSLKEEIWSEIKTLFERWERKLVKDAPKGHLCGHHLKDISKMKNESEKINILRQLNKGEITFKDFLQTLKIRKNQEECNEEENVDGDTQERKSEKDKRSDKEELKRLKEEIQSLKEQLSKDKQTIKNYIEENRKLKNEVKNSKEAAEKIEKLLKMEQQKKQENTSEKQEREDSEHTIKTLRLTIKRLEAQLFLRKELSANEESKEKKKDQHLPKKEQPKGVNDEKEKRNEKHLPEDTVNDEKITVAVVEYTKGSVYLGILKEDNSFFTFCKKPLGIKGKEMSFSENALKINKRDVQKINTNYILITFQTTMKNEFLEINTQKRKLIAEAFENLI